MRFLTASAANFGSYKTLEFDFKDIGLALVHGSTGAGKSTLQDLIPWVLFGVTSKGGKVDDIKAWDSDSPTTGTLTLEGGITVTRIRGSSSQNDLYWADADMGPCRGKDITDTQRLINVTLGVTVDDYLTSAYFNEFSSTSSFFTDKKSKQRELFESLADLSVPTKLQEGIADAKKETSSSLRSMQQKFSHSEGRCQELENNRNRATASIDLFERGRVQRISEAERKSETFEEEKQEKVKKIKEDLHKFEMEKVRNVESTLLRLEKFRHIVNTNEIACDKCGSPNEAAAAAKVEIARNEMVLGNFKKAKNPYIDVLALTQQQVNHWDNKVSDLQKEYNPFVAQLVQATQDLLETKEHNSRFSEQINTLENDLLSLSQLHKIVNDFRGILLVRSTEYLEDTTNHYLQTYFDGEIKVKFDLNSDTMDVSITKNSFDCPYSQLSRGQRSMLRLSFAVAVMKASSNKSGVHFSALFFDEVLDGLSADLKIKALGVFQELEKDHETVIITDHATEIQSYFNTRFLVTLESDHSSIERLYD